MKINQKILAVTAVLAAGLLAGCGAASSSTASSAVSVSSVPASSVAASSVAASSEAEQIGAVQPIAQDTLKDMQTGSYKFAARITAIKDGQASLTVYGYDSYEKDAIDSLQEGDVISTHLDGASDAQDVTIDSIERNEETGNVIINGGVEEGGIELCTDHDVYRTLTMDDYPVYYTVGDLTLPLAENVTLEDSSADPQASAVKSNGISAVEEAVNADPDSWFCNNTTVSTDNGSVSSIVRIWVP